MLCLGFERHIRPLFRDKDQTSMLKVSGLWSHGEVLPHPDAVLDQLRQSSTPCDGTWPRDQAAPFSRWISATSQPWPD